MPFTYFTGEAGTRIPHLWLDESNRISTLDWIKGQFVLIANNGHGWQDECDQVKSQFGIMIRLITLDNNKELLEKWQEVTGTGGNEALLIRPDDFVAAKLSPGDLRHVVPSILSVS